MKTVVTYGAVASGAFCTVARLCLPHVPSRTVALQVFQVSLLPWPASSPIWGEMLFWLCSSLTLEGPHGRAVWAGGETIASFDGPFRNEAALSESRLKLSSAQHACSFSQIPFVLAPQTTSDKAAEPRLQTFASMGFFLSWPLLQFGLQWAISNSASLL